MVNGKSNRISNLPFMEDGLISTAVRKRKLPKYIHVARIKMRRAHHEDRVSIRVGVVRRGAHN